MEFDLEKLGLVAALATALISIWRAFQEKNARLEAMSEAQSKLMAVIEKSLDRTENQGAELLQANRDMITRMEVLTNQQRELFERQAFVLQMLVEGGMAKRSATTASGFLPSAKE